MNSAEPLAGPIMLPMTVQLACNPAGAFRIASCEAHARASCWRCNCTLSAATVCFQATEQRSKQCTVQKQETLVRFAKV